jgi:DNA (cytosine-5)-methyltransferase 1
LEGALGRGRPYKTIDLFAGAGGLTIGFESEGFEAVAAVEFDSDAAQTYRATHGDESVAPRNSPKVHEEDICSVDFRQYRDEVDVVVGGPPCQPWSLGGLRKGHADPRDGIPQFVRALHEIQPEAFIMENVAGLVRGKAKSAFEQVLDVLRGASPPSDLLGSTVSTGSSLEYNVTYEVLHAADFGVPQTRRRLFVVGTRNGKKFEWPSPTHGEDRPLPYRAAGSVVGVEPVGDPNPSIVTFAHTPSLRPDPYHGQVFNGGGRPIDPSRPAPTLLASMGGNKTPWVDTLGIVPSYHEHLRGGGTPRTGPVPGARRITVEEAAALQTFPRTMRFAGKRSSQYRQVGNAVPPLLAAVVARQLLAVLS